MNTEAQIAHSRKKVLGRRAQTETIRWLIASGCFWNPFLDFFGILWKCLDFAGFYLHKHARENMERLKKTHTHYH